jgi:hypothetical protein
VGSIIHSLCAKRPNSPNMGWKPLGTETFSGKFSSYQELRQSIYRLVMRGCTENFTISTCGTVVTVNKNR